MASKKNDPHELLDLIHSCPPEFEVGPMVGTGVGQGMVFMYRNYELDLRKVYRVQVELAANDPTFPHIKRAAAPEKKASKKAEA